MFSSSSEPQSTSGSTQSVRGKTDLAWEHCTELPPRKEGGKPILKCLYCGKEFAGGGINRLKQHLAGKKGDVKSCPKVPPDVRFRIEGNLADINERKKSSQDRWEQQNPYECNSMTFDGDGNGDDPDLQEIPPSHLQPQSLTQKGKRKASGHIGNYFAPRTTPGAQPSIKSVMVGKEAVHKANLAVVRFFYDTCISLNAVNSVYYQPMIDGIAAIGPGYKGPNYHSMRIGLLHDIKKEVQLLVDTCRKTWEETGCTIMADGWKDQANRQLINFLVYCPQEISFIRSIDASNIVKDARTLCNLFVELVEFVGPRNVVHLVTDNAANYKAAGRLLNEKYPSIFWSPCAAHCLNLILGDIGKMDHVSSLAKHASMVSKFVYNHAYLLAWLRKREGWVEIIRPGPTRFATTFIALKSMHEHKHDLQALVTSKMFVESRYSKDNKAKDVVDVILDKKFWNESGIIVQIVAPLIHVLRIVDADERPSLGYVYDGMFRARKAIKNIFMNKKSFYKPYTRIIKQRWDRQLRQKVHAAAYVLNPALFYDKENLSAKPEVMQGFLDVLEHKVTSNRTKFLNESMLYQLKQEEFSRSMAIESSKTMRPDQWWRLFGHSAPNVQKLAISLLSQTASSSGCERNWSVFERIHTKKRNKLEHQRLNDLVFIHYNLRLKNRNANKKKTCDPIDYESIDKVEFWIMEEDNTPLLDYDELEKMLYNEEAIPKILPTQDEGSGVDAIAIDDRTRELNFDSFPQEDVNSYSGNDFELENIIPTDGPHINDHP